MDNSDPGGGIAAIFTIAVFGGLIALVIRWVRKRPRYIVDERGERQRVVSWNRGQPVYTPKTWQQRIFEEATLRRQRRWEIVGSAPFVFGPAYLYYYAYTQQSMLLGGIGGILILSATLPGLFYFLPALIKELLYQSDYQGMDGAKVLDAQPGPPPGKDVVESQMAHGSARVASEDEALALLKSKK